MAPLKVLICGGGVGGLALAFWLDRAREKFDVTLVERTPQLRASGQQIDLRGQGLTVMRRMGLEAVVRSHLVDEEGVQIVDDKGRRMAAFLANKTGRGKQGMTAEFEIMRGDLVRILYDAARDTAKFIFGVYVTALEQHDNVVDVVFSDGTTGTFDLVVGADGLSSRTRRLAFSGNAEANEEDIQRRLGVTYALFTITRQPSDTNLATVHHSPGRAILTRADNPRTMQVYLAVHRDHPQAAALEKALAQAKTLAEQKQVWADIFRDDVGWQTPRILDALLNDPLADDFYVQKLIQVRMPAYSRGRVVLVGDAGYCPTPVTGFGTSAAMVGAYILAGELDAHARERDTDDGSGNIDIPAALAAYDTRLRPLMDKVMKLPSFLPGALYPRTRWGIWILHTFVWLMVSLRIDKIMLALSSDDIQVKDGWQLPEYPSLAPLK